MADAPQQAFWRALAFSPFLMVRLQGSSEHSLPMTSVLDEDIQPETIWFFTTKDNRLAAGGPAMAQFVSRGQDLFACISGVITAEDDPHVIDHLWSSTVAEWYEQGRADPALHVLRMTLDDMEIWSAAPSNKGWFRRLTHDAVAAGDAWQHVHEGVATEGSG